MAYGTEHGLAIVDIVQKTCLLNMATHDLYGKIKSLFDNLGSVFLLCFHYYYYSYTFQ